MLLLIDNRDSFTFNLYQYLRELGVEVVVQRASELTLERVLDQRPQAVITGPGPGHPREATLSLVLAREIPTSIPLLGVCLGHQAMALALGAEIEQLEVPWHGRTSRLQHAGEGLFRNLPQGFEVGRYHSLAVRRDRLPAHWKIEATSEDGAIQALAHRERPLYGVQFHPESILSSHGHTLLGNFVRTIGA